MNYTTNTHHFSTSLHSLRSPENVDSPEIKKGDIIGVNGKTRLIYNGERVIEHFPPEPSNLQPSNLQPTELDFQAIRVIRQRETHHRIIQSIMENGELPKQYINSVQLQETIEELGVSQEQLFEECKTNRTLAVLLARNIAKKASRQGTCDENLQITVCHEVARQFGISIENLGVRAYRPTKTGHILTQDELTARKVPNNECLKSFDGKISGTIRGWIFAKVVYGSGGHQDSVFVESDIMCEWVKRFRDPEQNELFVVLIDTDLTKKMDTLQQKYKDVEGLCIMNHVAFQQYIIDTFSGKRREEGGTDVSLVGSSSSEKGVYAEDELSPSRYPHS